VNNKLAKELVRKKPRWDRVSEYWTQLRMLAPTSKVTKDDFDDTYEYRISEKSTKLNAAEKARLEENYKSEEFRETRFDTNAEFRYDELKGLRIPNR